MIVVDLGCSPHGTEVSIHPLIARFRPELLYGFDPLLDKRLDVATVEGIRCRLSHKAAWTFDGEVPMLVGETPWEGARSTVMVEETEAKGNLVQVPCFDLAKFLTTLHKDGNEVVLKMDVEGAEYSLLEHLISTGTDEYLLLLLVEWHEVPGADERGRAIVRDLRCKVEPW